MRLITRQTDYAIQALCYMASRPGVVPVSLICRELDMPRAFLRQLLQKLNAAGVLASTKGKGGGFVLAQKPDRITLLGIMEIFQDPQGEDACVFRKRACPRIRGCKLRQNLHQVENAALKAFSGITLKALIGK